MAFFVKNGWNIRFQVFLGDAAAGIFNAYLQRHRQDNDLFAAWQRDAWQ
ncbi:MAG: hypothetical protein MZV70_37100 [Desulfobacterales bacterium]|nr:hypothetical protein [Desulfobacterales bacterium]